MTKLTITFKPTSGTNQFVYNTGDVHIAISLDKKQPQRKTYCAALYYEPLIIMGVASNSSNNLTLEKRGHKLTTSFNGTHLHTQHVWLPGNYYLLLNDLEGNIIRFGLTLDTQCVFNIRSQRQCQPLSDEDILSSSCISQKGAWVGLFVRSGMNQIKRWVIERCKENRLNDIFEKNDKKALKQCDNMLITIPHKESAFISLMHHAANMQGEWSFGDCADFYNPNQAIPYQKLEEFFEKSNTEENFLSIRIPVSGDKVYLFYNIGALYGNGGKTIMHSILKHWPSDNRYAIFTGSQQEINSLLAAYPILQDYFPQRNRLSIEPYSREELIRSFIFELSIAKLAPAPSFVDAACRLISDAYSDGIITQWNYTQLRHYIIDHFLPIYRQHAIKGIHNGQNITDAIEMQVSDLISSFQTFRNISGDSTLDELNSMIGLDEIKQSITTLTHRVQFINQRRSLGLTTSDSTSLHAIFTGNPGTGKTTVARMLGKIYHSIGVLSRGDVICVDRTNMIGRYIGETEENMKYIIEEAKGNILFIDEAYTLYSPGDEKDFGRKALDCLLNVLTCPDPDMVVIMAGYAKEMDTLMTMNPGLVGRFPYKFHFANYTVPQLMQIAQLLLTKDQYELTPNAEALLYQAICDTANSHNEHFANARWIEQFIRNGIIPSLANRLSTTLHPLDRATYQLIEEADVRAAYALFNPHTIDLKPCRKVIGFSA
jgi:hypothetical protein